MRAAWVMGLVLAASVARAEDQDLGRVEDVDPDTREIELARGKVLKVDRQAEVFRNGARVSVEQLEEGDEVRATYDVEGNLLQVEAVGGDEVLPSSEGWEAPKNMSQCLPGAKGAC
jgi:hypothetical protein